jgi:hypothetical protein
MFTEGIKTSGEPLLLLLKHKKIFDFCMHELRIRHLEIFNGKGNFCSVGNKRYTSVRTKKVTFSKKKIAKEKDYL